MIISIRNKQTDKIQRIESNNKYKFGPIMKFIHCQKLQKIENDLPDCYIYFNDAYLITINTM